MQSPSMIEKTLDGVLIASHLFQNETKIAIIKRTDTVLHFIKSHPDETELASYGLLIYLQSLDLLHSLQAIGTHKKQRIKMIQQRYDDFFSEIYNCSSQDQVKERMHVLMHAVNLAINGTHYDLQMRHIDLLSRLSFCFRHSIGYVIRTIDVVLNGHCWNIKDVIRIEIKSLLKFLEKLSTFQEIRSHWNPILINHDDMHFERIEFFHTVSDFIETVMNIL